MQSRDKVYRKCRYVKKCLLLAHIFKSNCDDYNKFGSFYKGTVNSRVAQLFAEIYIYSLSRYFKNSNSHRAVIVLSNIYPESIFWRTSTTRVCEGTVTKRDR